MPLAVEAAVEGARPIVAVLVAISVLLLVLGWSGDWRATLTNLGASILTGAIVTGAFFLLQKEDSDNQKRLADRQARQEQQIADRQARQQRQLADRQTIGLQRDLSHADLAGRELTTFDLGGKNLRNADLAGAKLVGARLRGAALDGTQLGGAQLARADLLGARLNGAFLSGADLRDAQASDAQFEAAALGPDPKGRGATLAGTILINAHFHRACLAQADLRHAVLGGADLSDAVLTGADLRGANLVRDGVAANFHGAWVAGVKVDAAQRPLLKGAHGAPAPAVSNVPARGTLAGLPPRAIRDRVIGVSDGDTVLLAKRGWVRLVGIDASQPTSPLGRRAWAFLKGEQRRDATVYYRPGTPALELRDHGGVGRRRAYIWFADGRSVNETMLLQGYAIRQRRQEDRGPIPALDRAERQAKAAGRGAWATCPTG